MADQYVSAMRWHELALQRWLYSRFFVSDGYPIPVVFTAPMDAFSYFEQLWKSENSPFQYLLDAKDDKGTPLYLPHPAPARYPVISVHRKGWKYRATQNYSIHQYRHINWPTYADNVVQGDLGRVTVSQRPMAWDFIYQIDHQCLYPGDQALFLQAAMSTFWRTGGGLQDWLRIAYPAPFLPKRVRLYVQGDGFDSLTPEETPSDRVTIYRTSFNVVIEGYLPNLRLEELPALWKFALNTSIPATPSTLETLFTQTTTVDLRTDANNQVMASRDNVPAPGTAAV